MAIGNKIYELRKENKLSQEKLAERIGVTRQTISNWELNESSPDLKQANILAEVFGVSLDELVGHDLKNVFVEKVNKNNLSMMRLNKIVFSLFLTTFAFLFVLVLILLSIYKTLKEPKKHADINKIDIVCETNSEKVFVTTSKDNFDKIKNVYETQGVSCYKKDRKN